MMATSSFAESNMMSNRQRRSFSDQGFHMPTGCARYSARGATSHHRAAPRMNILSDHSNVGNEYQLKNRPTKWPFNERENGPSSRPIGSGISDGRDDNEN